MQRRRRIRIRINVYVSVKFISHWTVNVRSGNNVEGFRMTIEE